MIGLEKKTSYYLDEKLAERAVDLVLMGALAALKLHVFKRESLAICVLDLNGDLLFSKDIKGKDWGDHDFSAIALSKAEVAYKNKKDSVLVDCHTPWNAEEGETPYQGGAYYKGLAVGVSGVESYFDQMIAKWIIAAISALCDEARLKTKKEMAERNLDFLPAKE